MIEELYRYFVRLTSPEYNPVAVISEYLLICVVVYTVLRFLQGTGGARLLRGVLLLVIVAFVVVRAVADRLEWQRIQVLYEYFLLGLFLTSVVVFQPELRRGLMRLGETRLLRGWASDLDRLIDQLVAAAAYLSKRKIGALIAIERDVGLGMLAESGVPLDARVSADLLNTLFWPGSPLHDMGVIIRQGRIVAAGCQFPLADGENVDRSLGSRHRAALGASMESDALVLVVSEETGTVSVALRGRLIRGLTADQLRRFLRAHLAPPAEQQRESGASS